MCIVFAEKYIPMSGGDKQYCHRSIQLQYLRYYLSTNFGTLVVYIAKTVYVLHHIATTLQLAALMLYS